MRFCFWYLFILLYSSSCNAHSWLDRLDRNPNVTRAIAPMYDWIFDAAAMRGICEGYARYYPSRADPDINIGFTRLFYPGQNVPLCPDLPGSGYGGWLHELTASPGDVIFFGYTSNGHIGSDFSAVGTNISIYWSADVFATSFDLIPDRLLVQVPFVDGVCGEKVTSRGEPTNLSGINVPCVQNFTVPNTTSGQYSFVWHWKDNNDVVYWSCFDITIIINAPPTSTIPSPTPTPPYKKS